MYGFPELVAEPVASPLSASAWDLVDDRLAARIGAWPRTTLEAGIDRMIAAGCARRPATMEHS